MFFSLSKSKLGIDIGTSSIKAVQLKKEREAQDYHLETYGTVNVAAELNQRSELDVISRTAEIIKQLLVKAQVTTKKVVASLPNSIVFVSVIEMPALSEKELKSAVDWEARRYVPLPLEEVTLSWSVLSEPPQNGKNKVLLTAVPTSVIDNYLQMFKLAGLEPLALEIEALALIRSLVGAGKECVLIIDIGARNTSLNLVDKGFLRVSRNLAIGGDTLTQAVSQSLKISFGRAEQFKKDLGVMGGADQIPQAMRPALDTIKNETRQLLKIYESTGGAVRHIIFTGSGAYLPGLINYFSDIGIKAALGDPLQFIKFDQEIKPHLSRAALGLSVAIGLAIRE
ncbi:MAG: type IV pilus assembly protein PilM [Candidatus Doudnabacteria bacterium]|nr:type IV pilus assembly protein PilM [Candidatus Doudnabacteria bacterium]